MHSYDRSKKNNSRDDPRNTVENHRKTSPNSIFRRRKKEKQCGC